MKKDIFEGKIKKEFIGDVKFCLVFGSILGLGFTVFFLLLGLLDENMDFDARIAMFVISGLSLIGSILFLTLTIYAIKNYPKYPKLAKVMLQPIVFEEFESDV